MRISQKVKGVLMSNLQHSYYFHKKSKIWADFEICISVPLTLLYALLIIFIVSGMLRAWFFMSSQTDSGFFGQYFPKVFIFWKYLGQILSHITVS